MLRRQRGSGRGTDASGIDELCLSRGKQGGLSGGSFRPLGSSKRKF
jgi:hypothetical protein